MEDRFLTMKDGSVVHNAYALESSGRLFVYVMGALSLIAMMQIFGDSEKTGQIRSTEYGESKVYQGYTHLVTLSEETEGAFYTASLRKEQS